VRIKNSTSRRSRRQSLAQGGASEASGTLGNDTISLSARFSGRKNLSPAKAGSRITFWRVPRVALRFTSFRSAYPGLNSAAGYAGSLGLVLLSLTFACGKKEPPTPTAAPENYPNLTARTKEICDAFTNKDYLKVLELTYPKVIETGGGREKMMATMKDEIKGMETEGVVLLSTTPGSPSQFVHDAGSIYAVVPITVKMKAQQGIFQTEATLIGISADGGAGWTFIDAAGEDEKKLRMLLPNTLDKLKLPAEKPPVKISG